MGDHPDYTDWCGKTQFNGGVGSRPFHVLGSGPSEKQRGNWVHPFFSCPLPRLPQKMMDGTWTETKLFSISCFCRSILSEQQEKKLRQLVFPWLLSHSKQQLLICSPSSKCPSSPPNPLILKTYHNIRLFECHLPEAHPESNITLPWYLCHNVISWTGDVT